MDRFDISEATSGHPAANESAECLPIVRIAKKSLGWASVRLPEEVCDAMKRIRDMISEDDLGEDGKEAHPHITLKYGLTGDDPDEVKMAVAGNRGGRVKMGKTSLFVKDDCEVLKISVAGHALHALWKALSELDNEDTFKEYVPHATLAYLKPGAGKKYSGLNTIDGMEFTFDSFVFEDASDNKTDIKLDGKIPDRKTVKTASAGRILSAKGRDNHGNTFFATLKGDPKNPTITLQEESGRTYGKWTWYLSSLIDKKTDKIYLDYGQGWYVEGMVGIIAEAQSIPNEDDVIKGISTLHGRHETEEEFEPSDESWKTTAKNQKPVKHAQFTDFSVELEDELTREREQEERDRKSMSRTIDPTNPVALPNQSERFVIEYATNTGWRRPRAEESERFRSSYPTENAARTAIADWIFHSDDTDEDYRVVSTTRGPLAQPRFFIEQRNRRGWERGGPLMWLEGFESAETARDELGRFLSIHEGEASLEDYRVVDSSGNPVADQMPSTEEQENFIVERRMLDRWITDRSAAFNNGEGFHTAEQAREAVDSFVRARGDLQAEDYRIRGTSSGVVEGRPEETFGVESRHVSDGTWNNAIPTAPGSWQSKTFRTEDEALAAIDRARTLVSPHYATGNFRIRSSLRGILRDPSISDEDHAAERFFIESKNMDGSYNRPNHEPFNVAFDTAAEAAEQAESLNDTNVGVRISSSRTGPLSEYSPKWSSYEKIPPARKWTKVTFVGDYDTARQARNALEAALSERGVTDADFFNDPSYYKVMRKKDWRPPSSGQVTAASLSSIRKKAQFEDFSVELEEDLERERQEEERAKTRHAPESVVGIGIPNLTVGDFYEVTYNTGLPPDSGRYTGLNRSGHPNFEMSGGSDFSVNPVAIASIRNLNSFAVQKRIPNNTDSGRWEYLTSPDDRLEEVVDLFRTREEANARMSREIADGTPPGHVRVVSLPNRPTHPVANRPASRPRGNQPDQPAVTAYVIQINVNDEWRDVMHDFSEAGAQNAIRGMMAANPNARRPSDYRVVPVFARAPQTPVQGSQTELINVWNAYESSEEGVSVINAAKNMYGINMSTLASDQDMANGVRDVMNAFRTWLRQSGRGGIGISGEATELISGYAMVALKEGAEEATGQRTPSPTKFMIQHEFEYGWDYFGSEEEPESYYTAEEAQTEINDLVEGTGNSDPGMAYAQDQFRVVPCLFQIQKEDSRGGWNAVAGQPFGFASESDATSQILRIMENDPEGNYRQLPVPVVDQPVQPNASPARADSYGIQMRVQGNWIYYNEGRRGAPPTHFDTAERAQELIESVLRGNPNNSREDYRIVPFVNGRRTESVATNQPEELHNYVIERNDGGRWVDAGFVETDDNGNEFRQRFDTEQEAQEAIDTAVNDNPDMESDEFRIVPVRLPGQQNAGTSRPQNPALRWIYSVEPAPGGRLHLVTFTRLLVTDQNRLGDRPDTELNSALMGRGSRVRARSQGANRKRLMTDAQLESLRIDPEFENSSVRYFIECNMASHVGGHVWRRMPASYGMPQEALAQLAVDYANTPRSIESTGGARNARIVDGDGDEAFPDEAAQLTPIYMIVHQRDETIGGLINFEVPPPPLSYQTFRTVSAAAAEIRGYCGRNPDVQEGQFSIVNVQTGETTGLTPPTNQNRRPNPMPSRNASSKGMQKRAQFEDFSLELEEDLERERQEEEIRKTRTVQSPVEFVVQRRDREGTWENVDYDRYSSAAEAWRHAMLITPSSAWASRYRVVDSDGNLVPKPPQFGEETSAGNQSNQFIAPYQLHVRSPGTENVYQTSNGAEFTEPDQAWGAATSLINRNPAVLRSGISVTDANGRTLPRPPAWGLAPGESHTPPFRTQYQDGSSRLWINVGTPNPTAEEAVAFANAWADRNNRSRLSTRVIDSHGVHVTDDNDQSRETQQSTEPPTGRPRSSSGRYVEFSFDQVGNLVMTPTADGIEEARELIDNNRQSDSDFTEMIEDHLANGWQMVSASDIGAMTEALFITNDVDIDDQGDVTRIGDAWSNIYHYQISGEVHEFSEGLPVTWRKVSSNRENDGPRNAESEASEVPVERHSIPISIRDAGHHTLEFLRPYTRRWNRLRRMTNRRSAVEAMNDLMNDAVASSDARARSVSYRVKRMSDGVVTDSATSTPPSPTGPRRTTESGTSNKSIKQAQFEDFSIELEEDLERERQEEERAKTKHHPSPAETQEHDSETPDVAFIIEENIGTDEGEVEWSDEEFMTDDDRHEPRRFRTRNEAQDFLDRYFVNTRNTVNQDDFRIVSIPDVPLPEKRHGDSRAHYRIEYRGTSPTWLTWEYAHNSWIAERRMREFPNSDVPIHLRVVRETDDVVLAEYDQHPNEANQIANQGLPNSVIDQLVAGGEYEWETYAQTPRRPHRGILRGIRHSPDSLQFEVENGSFSWVAWDDISRMIRIGRDVHRTTANRPALGIQPGGYGVESYNPQTSEWERVVRIGVSRTYHDSNLAWEAIRSLRTRRSLPYANKPLSQFRVVRDDGSRTPRPADFGTELVVQDENEGILVEHGYVVEWLPISDDQGTATWREWGMYPTEAAARTAYRDFPRTSRRGTRHSVSRIRSIPDNVILAYDEPQTSRIRGAESEGLKKQAQFEDFSIELEEDLERELQEENRKRSRTTPATLPATAPATQAPTESARQIFEDFADTETGNESIATAHRLRRPDQGDAITAGMAVDIVMIDATAWMQRMGRIGREWNPEIKEAFKDILNQEFSDEDVRPPELNRPTASRELTEFVDSFARSAAGQRAIEEASIRAYPDQGDGESLAVVMQDLMSAVQSFYQRTYPHESGASWRGVEGDLRDLVAQRVRQEGNSRSGVPEIAVNRSERPALNVVRNVFSIGDLQPGLEYELTRRVSGLPTAYSSSGTLISVDYPGGNRSVLPNLTFQTRRDDPTYNGANYRFTVPWAELHPIRTKPISTSSDLTPGAAYSWTLSNGNRGRGTFQRTENGLSVFRNLGDLTGSRGEFGLHFPSIVTLERLAINPGRSGIDIFNEFSGTRGGATALQNAVDSAHLAPQVPAERLAEEVMGTASTWYENAHGDENPTENSFDANRMEFMQAVNEAIREGTTRPDAARAQGLVNSYYRERPEEMATAIFRALSTRTDAGDLAHDMAGRVMASHWWNAEHPEDPNEFQRVIQQVVERIFSRLEFERNSRLQT